MQNCHLALSHLNNDLQDTFRESLKYANNDHSTPQKGSML